jgi:drug/metabolite transporter (DMT)-like permease
LDQGSITDSGKSVLLAVSSTDDDSTLRVADTHENGKVFEGFVVGVNQLEEIPVEDTAVGYSESTPLLGISNVPKSRESVSPKHKVVRRKSSFLEMAEDAFVLSIPFQQMRPMSEENDEDVLTPLATERNAYLIELPPPNGRMRGESQQFVLAVPGTETLYKRPSLLRRLSTLPTDVKEVAVETMETKDGTLEVQLLVKREVPLVGYLLLLASLLTISSLGAALDLQTGVDPFIKLFWRCTASLLAFSPLVALAVYQDGFPKLNPQIITLFLLCCVSYSLFLMTFLWSLNHTTIGHAYIFNNCHSLIIVLGKILVGSYVSQSEALGTGIGILGGILTTMDSSSPTDTTATATSFAGDLVALIGAVGGVLYLVTAKKLRLHMDVSILMTGVFFVTSLLHFPIFWFLQVPYDLSTDDTVGLFGWLSSDRLVSELYIVLICTLIGTLGYVSVMKYFDPIVVSVVMLLEPIIATIMGVVVGVDVIPGIVSMAGTILIIIGTTFVIMSNTKKVEFINATEALSNSTMPNGLSSRALLKKTPTLS